MVARRLALCPGIRNGCGLLGEKGWQMQHDVEDLHVDDVFTQKDGLCGLLALLQVGAGRQAKLGAGNRR